ncbi:MAG: HEPN domain-containing protein [Candidatus Schekmanbacteria bacterium]|nr:HEPN domain-containing protein [Candidatus Schekmanbacteria bacterium]
MKDIKQASSLLTMAYKDFTALKHMLDEEDFAEEIFGFHIQQAIEKSLKAWLALKGILYPKIHNINLLLQLLKQNGAHIDSFTELIEYNSFAVQFRYEEFDLTDAPIDRRESIRQVGELLKHVRQLLDITQGG